jgi:hypothetical protein
MKKLCYLGHRTKCAQEIRNRTACIKWTLWHLTSDIPIPHCGAQNVIQVQITAFNGLPYTALKFQSSAHHTRHLIPVPNG